MSSHALDASDLLSARTDGQPEAALPGEDAAPLTPGPDDRIGAASVEAPSPRHHRLPLIAGVSALALVAVAGGIYLASGSPAQAPAAPQAANSPAHPTQKPVAPAASLAIAPHPDHESEAIRPPAKSEPKTAVVKDFLSLHDGVAPKAPVEPGVNPAAEHGLAQPGVNSPAAGSPDAVSPSPPASIDAAAPAKIAAVSPPPEGTVPVGPTTNPVALTQHEPIAAPAEPGAAPSGKHVDAKPVETKPADPAATAASLKPGPLSTPQEIQVLSLVTELGALVRDQRAELAALRADQRKTGDLVETKLTDYDRRLALAEAKGSIAAAMGGSSPATPLSQPVAQGRVQPVPLQQAKAAAPATAPAADTAPVPHRYRVQAASPNLAMLTEIGRSGDDGAQLQIAVGDPVPGYGKVTSIAQRGTAWVVVTDHGTLQ
ncbi:MAG TPA: hypothetical protein VGV37_30260 [Aliidongia sp.]|uniref:hypothetical protein n=1 Tax=Aliidongia sp. TaxID=1914230 RepID=UPI002DDCF080|nr:hypothetical protein [Aliidongia sp.]HEV2678851.1 hypothetical protein [Aliidongia sp.]